MWSVLKRGWLWSTAGPSLTAAGPGTGTLAWGTQAPSPGRCWKLCPAPGRDASPTRWDLHSAPWSLLGCCFPPGSSSVHSLWKIFPPPGRPMLCLPAGVLGPLPARACGISMATERDAKLHSSHEIRVMDNPFPPLCIRGKSDCGGIRFNA